MARYRTTLPALLAAAALLGPALALAQDRDFLSREEVDKVREAQEPNARLMLYLEFAHDRVAQLTQLLSKERAGRSGLAHDLLEDYGNIIDAIDTVADDALLRKVDVSEGLLATVAAEKELLPKLQAIWDAQPSDLARYEFVLENAIDTTKDSLELSARDMGSRQAEVIAKERRQEAARDAALSPEETKQKKAEAAKQPKQRKLPTLRRPDDPPPRIPPAPRSQ